LHFDSLTGDLMGTNQNLSINYPTEWIYKVIGTDIVSMKAAISSIIHSDSLSITQSRESKSGKYSSLNVKVTVVNEEERKLYFTELGKHVHIKMVL
jgi:uncharacterized protein